MRKCSPSQLKLACAHGVIIVFDWESNLCEFCDSALRQVITLDIKWACNRSFYHFNCNLVLIYRLQGICWSVTFHRLCFQIQIQFAQFIFGHLILKKCKWELFIHIPFSRASIWALVKEVLFLCSFLLRRMRICSSVPSPFSLPVPLLPAELPSAMKRAKKG